MDIREAITKAGPGGKIRLSHWPVELSIINNDGTLEYGNTKEPVGLFRASEVTSPNWEVVPEERIEQGDVVKLSTGREMVVRAIENDAKWVCASDKDNEMMDMFKVEFLTLIHKGPKRHVHEKVCFIFGGLRGDRPVVEMYGQGVIDTDKKYRMTLEETE